MDTIQLCAALQTSQSPIDQLHAPPQPGIYALFLAGDVGLPGVSVPSCGLLYVGSSANLEQRQLHTHFSSRQTSRSTVRRSLGAILKEHLHLTARARGHGKTQQDSYCYRFASDDDEHLTEWMQGHIHIAIHAAREYRRAEAELISTARPLLNLTGFANPAAGEIKRLRKVCADEARRHDG